MEARAGLYTRTLSPRDALKLLERDFRHELSRRLRSPRLLPLRETQRLLGERAPAHAPALKAALGELAILKAQPPGRLDDLVPFSRRLAELLEEIR